MVPPSRVSKRRPSIAVTVAVRASVAWMAVRSRGSGNVMRRQVWPSVVSSTTPPDPTSQHTVGDGELPAVREAWTPGASGCHVAAPSVVRSTLPAAENLHLKIGSGDVTTRSAGAPPRPPAPRPPTTSPPAGELIPVPDPRETDCAEGVAACSAAVAGAAARCAAAAVGCVWAGGGMAAGGGGVALGAATGSAVARVSCALKPRTLSYVPATGEGVRVGGAPATGALPCAASGSTRPRRSCGGGGAGSTGAGAGADIEGPAAGGARATVSDGRSVAGRVN